MTVARQTHVAHFTMKGEDFTRLARDFMLSELPGKAWRLVTQGLHGPGGAERFAADLLDGKKKLIGNESSMRAVKDSSKGAQGYIKTLKYIYAGRLCIDRTWWRPKAEIVDFGPDDMEHAGKVVYEGRPRPVGAPSRKREIGLQRVAFYAGTRDRVVEVRGATSQFEEEDRQLVLLALARLSLERPGWDYVLNLVALKMDNQADRTRAELYDNFRGITRDTAWHKLIDTRDQDERMNDSDLADEIITRLNKLIENPAVRDDIGKLIETRILCSQATLDHPTIQASPPDRNGLCECGGFGGPGCPLCKPQCGFLGILNGLVGILPEGRQKGWGYVMAVFDDNKKLERFRRTDAVKAVEPL